MATDEFARVESLFHAALTQPPEQRARFLQSIEPSDAIRARVLRLLATDHADGTDPVSSRLHRILREHTATPRTIDAYRLLGELGAGGMGTVFLAERDVAGVAQQVALKLLHGLPTESGKQQMARERSLLAGLNHPQIAGLIAGGETADGQPYLVMEFIEGTGLADYLAAVQPTLPARLRLFLQLCDAVAHAHQRLILHRDLKPSNVIVRADGTPVLLDFGVGKWLEGTQPDQHTAAQAFTPGYAAPEQQHGLAATTATDVFGLGALLFDLLTDRRLAELRKGDAPVPMPSHHAQVPTRQRALRGDLDRIVGKATAVDPRQRYPTAVALADDIQRHLQGKPVAAAPPTLRYRLRKFVVRHRIAVAAGLVAVVAASLFIARLDAERQRALAAERRALSAEALSQRTAVKARNEAANAKASRDFLASVLAQAAPENVRGQPITVSVLLAEAVKKLQAGLGGDAQARAVAWLTIAEVYEQIKDPQPGLQAADAALDLSRRTAVIDQELEARILRVRGRLLNQLERHGEARDAFQQLIALRERLGSDDAALSRAHADYAEAAMQWRAHALADRHLHRALTFLDAAGTDHDNARARLLLALAEVRTQQDDDEGADRYFARAQATAGTSWAGGDPRWFELHRIGSALRNKQGRFEEALRHSEQALRIAYQVYGERSRSTAEAESALADDLVALGRHRQALRHFERARTLTRLLELGDTALAQTDINVGAAYEMVGDYARAAELTRSGLARLPQDDPAYIAWRTIAHTRRGYALTLLGRFGEARPEFERALSLARNQDGETSTAYAMVQFRYARALVHARRLREAETALTAAKRIYARQWDARHPIWIALSHLEASLALERGDLTTASRIITRTLAKADKHPGVDAVSMARNQLLAARIALRQHDTTRARQLVRELLPTLTQALSPKAPELREARRLAQQLSM